MSQFLTLLFLAACAWIAGRFVYYYMTAEAVGTWPKVIEAAGDSATYFAAKASMFGAALLGAISYASDFLAGSSDGKNAVQEWLMTYITNPKIVSVVGIVLMALIWWARSRTKA